MTASTTLNYYIRAALTLKDRLTAATTTVYLSNRPVVSASATTQHLPILLAVNNIGSRMNGALPQVQQGYIVIENKPGTVGFERRFSDLLERLEFVEQPIVISVAPLAPGETNPTTWTSVFTANMLRGSLDARAGTFTIDIESNSVDRRIITRKISTLVETSAPDSSYNFALPIVLGANVDVQAVKIVESTLAPQFAYATTLSTEHPVGGIQKIYVRNLDGEYKEVQSASATGTAVWSNTTVAATETLPGLIDQNRLEIACWLDWDSSNNWLVSRIDIQGNGMNSGGLTVLGTVTVRIYEGVLNSYANAPGRLVGEGTRPAGLYQTGFRGASDFWMVFSFKEPVLLNSDRGYWLSFEYSSTSASGTGDPIELTTGGSFEASAVNFQRHDGGDWIADGTASDDVFNFKMYGVKFTDSTSSAGNAAGLGIAKCTLSQDSTETDLSGLDLIFSVNGLLDTAGGAITGTGSALLTSPVDALACLSQQWNGSAWTNQQFSRTNLPVSGATSTTFPRVIAGRTDGETTLADITGQICREHALRLALVNAATPLSLYAWGARVESSATLTDDNCKILRAYFGGLDSVINHVRMYYNKRLSTETLDESRVNDFSSNYIGALNWYNGANAHATFLCARSAAVFSDSEQGQVEFDWIQDDATAQSVANYFLRTYQFPTLWVDFECSLSDYYNIDLFDVVTILSPDLPAYFGSSASAKNPTYSSTEADILRHNYVRRAQPYRIQIEAREIILNDKALFPTLRFTGRALINPNEVT